MAFTDRAALEDISILKRQALPMRAAMILFGAGISIAVLDSMLPVLWGGVTIAAVLIDVPLFRWAAQRKKPVNKSLGALLFGWSLFVSTLITMIGVSLWLNDTRGSTAAAAIVWCAFVFRNATESGGRPVFALASTLPHAIAMLALPLFTSFTKPSTALFDREAVLVAEALFLIHTIYHLRRQANAARQIETAMDDMRRSERTARALFQQAPGAATLLDAELRYVAVSKNSCRLFRVDERDAIGRQFEEVVPWMPQSWRDAHRQALAGHAVVLSEDAVTWPDGKTSYSHIEFSPWRDDEGAICGVIVYGSDITPYVRARIEKETVATRLAVALHNTSAAVWEVDIAGRRLLGADKLGDVFDIRPTFADVIGTTAMVVHPDDRNLVISATRRAAARQERYSLDHRILSLNGEVKWAHTNGEVFTNEKGAIKRIVALSMDVTERKKLETGLIEAMRRAQNMLSGKRALLQAILRDIGAGETQQAADANENAAAAAGFEELYKQLENLLAEIDARDNALTEAVQALREARASAEAANVSKSQFLANMSHELRTPLNAVIGYAEILEEDLATAAPASAQDAERIRLAARHLLQLINEILDLSKIEAGKMDLVYDETDIVSLVRETLDTVRPTAEANDNMLSLKIEGDVGPVRADALRVKQCLLNLLANACKFTKGGTITVRMSLPRRAGMRWLTIDVADTGIGMNEEQRGRLFQPFVQADASTTRKFGGTGLGLALTRRFAQLMGGDVTVSSKPGEGSVFTLVLPADAEEEASPKPQIIGGERPLALIIEDDAAAREYATRALQRLGFTTRFATTAATGLAALKSEPPALVLLDIYLPDQSGWSILEAMQADPDIVDVPVIVTSADDDSARSYSLGACAHLLKPLEKDKLAAKVVQYARIRPRALSA